MQRNLTTGSVLKNTVLFSLPYFLSYFLQTLYGMADLYIIGKFGSVSEITAVSVGSQVMHMLTVMIVGLAMGTTVCVAQAVGGGDKQTAAKGVGNTAILFSAISVAITALLLLLVYPIVAAVSTPPAAVNGTAEYLKICFMGIPFITAYNVISSVFRGMGDSKSPMYFIIVACFANIILDILFIGVLQIGPAGAALGTTLSQAVSVVISLTYIIRQKVIILNKRDFKPHGKTLGKLLSVGAPIAAQDGLIQIAFIVITVIANKRGLTDAAAVGIVEKVIVFLFLVPSSMLSAVSALGAQNIGAGKPERAVQTLKIAVIITVSFGVFVAFVTQFAAEGIVSVFTSDGGVIKSGGQYLRGYIYDCIFAGIHFSFSGYFCACGKSWISFVHNISAIVLARIPGAYLMSKLFGTTLLPMGLATSFGSFVSVIICITAFAVIKRKSKNVVQVVSQ